MNLITLIFALWVTLASCAPPFFDRHAARWHTTVSQDKPGRYNEGKFWSTMSSLSASLDAIDPIMKKYQNPPARLNNPWDYIKDQNSFRSQWIHVAPQMQTLEEQLQAFSDTKDFVQFSYEKMYAYYDRLRKRAAHYAIFAETSTNVLKWMSKDTFVAEAKAVDRQGEGEWWLATLMKERSKIQAMRQKGGDYFNLEVQDRINKIREEIYRNL